MREKQKWEETEINTLEMQTPAVCHFQLVNRLRGGPTMTHWTTLIFICGRHKVGSLILCPP